MCRVQKYIASHALLTHPVYINAYVSFLSDPIFHNRVLGVRTGSFQVWKPSWERLQYLIFFLGCSLIKECALPKVNYSTVMSLLVCWCRSIDDWWVTVRGGGSSTMNRSKEHLFQSVDNSITLSINHNYAPPLLATRVMCQPRLGLRPRSTVSFYGEIHFAILPSSAFGLSLMFIYLFNPSSLMSSKLRFFYNY